jgi:hypothetical protein
MDHPLVASISVYDLVAEAFGRGIRSVFLDEIHTAPDWSRHIKALYDSFPGTQLCLSGSDTLVMSRGVGDLSRRVLSLPIPTIQVNSLSRERSAGHGKDENRRTMWCGIASMSRRKERSPSGCWV